MKSQTVFTIQNYLCIKCGKCFDVCPVNAVMKMKNEFCSKCIRYCISLDVPCNTYHYEINHQRCTGCGICSEICPSFAIIQRERKGCLEESFPDQ